MTSIDYDRETPGTLGPFATVQNKVYFAIHGQTAVEVIVPCGSRCYHSQQLR